MTWIHLTSPVAAGDNVPASLRLGKGAEIKAQHLFLGEGIVIGDNTVVAGDSVTIEDGVTIGSNSDLRAGEVQIGQGSEFGDRCRVLVAERFSVGHASRISSNCHITSRRFEAGAFLYFAQECSVGYGGTTESTAIVSIGDRVALGPHNIINANCEIHLDDQVGSGSFVTMWTHGYHFGHSILDGYAATFKPIHIKRNVWLAYHVTVLPGVTIGENSIIAACSVVTYDLPADCLAAGAPAEPRKELAKTSGIPSETADKTVIELLRSWGHELQWKGIKYRELPADARFAYNAEIAGNMLPSRVSIHFVAHDQNAPFRREEEGAIYVSVKEQPDIRIRLSGNSTLFELRQGRFTGASNPLSEDLRDFLRRHTLVCGDHRVFQSIEPDAFKRLRELIQSN